MVTAERVTALRAALAQAGVEGFIVPRADEHLGEYVPPGAERLAWLTGFTGSAGVAVVLAAEAAVFTDGRYVLQLAEQTDAALFQRLHLTDTPPQGWAASRAKRLGYDPWLLSRDGVARYAAAGITMVPLSPNPIDAIWSGRPPAPSAAAVPHGLALAGQPSSAKREAIAATLRAAGQECCVLTDPPSINWLLNLRGGDVAFTPVALAFAVLHADARTDLFIDPAKLDGPARQWLGNQVSVHPPGALGAALAGLAGRTVRVDGAGSPAAVGQILRGAGAAVVDGVNPCLLPKACKNPVEQAGARAAHRRDGVAVCRFLRWLETAGGETEMSAADRLLAFRQETAGFRDESFPAISGAGEHGAVIHYRVTAATDRPIRPGDVYLIDSGGQYEDGTTDITRTVWTGPGTPPAELRARFTQVLRGNIALATTVFPHGVAGPHLDVVARRPLWGMGLDYDHGTGHGVGSYLSVHEGPVSLSRAGSPSVPIEAGMILSNEPGYYEPGAYGIRLETLLLVQPAEIGAKKPFLRFEVLTLAPFDRTLIDPALLDPAERAWLDAYHAVSQPSWRRSARTSPTGSRPPAARLDPSGGGLAAGSGRMAVKTGVTFNGHSRAISESTAMPITRRALAASALGLCTLFPAMAQAAHSRDDARDLVQKACAYVASHGRGPALAAFNDPHGEFRDGDLYLYVLDASDPKLVMLAHGVNPGLVGLPQYDIIDADGFDFNAATYTLTKTAGSGWITYKWPNPQRTRSPSNKASFA